MNRRPPLRRSRSSASSRRSRTATQRQLRVQTLDARMLLAADLAADFDGPPSPAALESASTQSNLSEQVDGADVETEDVNRDGRVSALDALTIINRIRRGANRGDVDQDRFDVNRDGNITPSDALFVVNRMRRGPRVDPGPSDRPGGERPDDDRRGGDGPDRGNPDDGSPDEAEVQSIDGSGNNVENPELGSAGTELRRVVDADYADGVSEPSGGDRASAREISNLVFDQEESIPSEQGLSNLVWQWGQFLDHDITATEGGDGESFDIDVPAGDEHFDPFGTGEQVITLTRSAFADGTGVDSPAQQVNEITAFIDGSQIYGSDQETSDSLRSFEGGRLATSEGDLLPINESGFFEAGDERVNEQIGLISMHTLWVREHNRIADELSANDPDLTDEEVFQSARRQVIAQLQAITYNEYLPQLLGRGAIDRYTGYDSAVDPSISNLFATAAFRYGHTSLPSELARLNDDGTEIEAGSLALQDAFFQPGEIQEHGIDSILKGLASTPQQEIDTQVVDDVRNFLFGPPGAGGFDLASLNIQRGRDHGLPDYNSAREQMGLDRVESFADITSDVDVQARLASAYESVDDIDAWVGMLAEDHVGGGSVGELAGAVMAEQFMAIRDGDRFWYQNVLSPEEAREVSSTRLSDVIERNTELTSVQTNAFRVDDGSDGPGDRPSDRPGDGDRPDRDGPKPDRPRADGPRPDGPPPAPDAGDPPADPGVGDDEDRQRPPRPRGERPGDDGPVGEGDSDDRGDGPIDDGEPGERRRMQRGLDTVAVDEALGQLF